MTGQSFLIRNLDSEELLNLASYTQEEAQKDREIEVNRILFNREGEPFRNYSNLLKICNILQSNEEFQDTELLVSTAGLTPWIYRLANDNPRVRLWVSLNAPTPDLRSKLMPINRIYGLYQLIDACSHYANISGEKVRLNYILIENLNDSEECAIELARLVSGKPFRLQIAKMNSYAGYRSPHEQKIQRFLSVLENFGIKTEYFNSKGVAVGGGCGQAYRKEIS